MDDDIYQKQKETKYHGIANVPFPHASLSPKQREEQAYYEANSGGDGRLVLCLAKSYKAAIKMATKVLKGK